MEIVLYAYQFSPNPGDPMFFAQTLEKCRAEAVEQRIDLKRDPDNADLAPFSIYRCVVRMDVATYVQILTDPDDGVAKALVSKKLVELVME